MPDPMSLEETIAAIEKDIDVNPDWVETQAPYLPSVIHWLTTLKAREERLRQTLEQIAHDAGNGEIADSEGIRALLKETEPSE